MKTALVTGGATRIGRALSLSLAAAGWRVAVHYRHSAGEAAEVVEAIRTAGGEAVAVGAALDSGEACRAVVAEATAALGPVTLLINNASSFNREPLIAMTEASVMDAFWPNLIAPMLLTREVATAHDLPGVVVNLLDRRVKANDERFFAYGIAKKGLAAFTEMAAVALAPRFRVFGIAPGPILPPPGEDAAYLVEKGGRRLLDDPLDPEAIVGALHALLSLRGATGQTLYIDDGQHLLGNGV